MPSRTQLVDQMMSSRRELDDDFIKQASSKIQNKALLLDDVIIASNPPSVHFGYEPGSVTNGTLPSEYTQIPTNWVNQNVVSYDPGGFAAQADGIAVGASTEMSRNSSSEETRDTLLVFT